MEFTGERYIPTEAGEIKYEHLHRYALCKEFVAGKTVLDLASGEGYGAALMAEVAQFVIGVDLSPTTVQHARHKYYHQNLDFLVGNCEAVPLPGASVDAVTSFETIEHHDKHEEMMSEIKRVLKPGGLLFISSPNRLTYSDEPHYSNPFHVRELYFDEFNALLKRHFKQVKIYGQRLAAGSFVYHLHNSQSQQIKTYTGDSENLTQQFPSLPAPIYFIAICSDDVIIEPERVASIYVDAADDLLKKAGAERKELFGQVQKHLTETAKLKQYQEHLQKDINILSEQLETVRAQLREQEALLSQKSEERQALLSQKSEELAKKDEQLSQARAETESLRVQLLAVEEQLRKQADELSNKTVQLSHKTVELTESLSRISNLETQAERRAKEFALEAQSRMSELQGRIAGLESQLRQHKDEVKTLGVSLSNSEAHSARLHSMLAGERARSQSKKDILDWISNSRSWQLTAPLRRWSLRASRRRARQPQPERAVFRGFLDSPAESASAAGELEIAGWVYSTLARIARVEVFVNNIPLGAIRHGEPRPDVVKAFPIQAPIDCGFAGQIQLDDFLLGSALLMVRVTDENNNVKDFFRNITIEAAAEDVVSVKPLSLPERSDAMGGEMPLASRQDILLASKTALDSMAKISLDSFLSSNSEIELPSHETPQISIVLVLYNRAELTLQCLYSILRSNAASFELIIVDNASTDETPRLLRRIKGAQIVENETNLHYLKACNQALKRARGAYVLLLNNDAQVLAGTIPAALQTLASDDEIGAVGGKIILPDGSLQEAGSIVWQDGSCLGYGRGDSPFAPAYMFKRDVDYCSAAFLLTRRELLAGAGGFDEDYAPAYYEETDYCARLWEQGKRVVYDPEVIVFHYEFGSSSSQRKAIGLQAEHQQVFVSKHQNWLQSQRVAAPENVLPARSHQSKRQQRILFLDDRVPHLTLGSGFPRSNRILSELVRMRHAVTFYPTNFPQERWDEVYQDIPREVEVMLSYGWDRLAEFLSGRNDYYDLLFVSRPHNMAQLKSLLAEHPELCRNTRIIYDAEALFSVREIEQLRLEGQEPSSVEQEQLINEEVRLAENCACVISVSEKEGREFTRRGLRRVQTLGHALNLSPTHNSFDERRDILFVGAVHSPTSPNADSMYWFSEKVLPLIQEKLGQNIKLVIAGPSSPGFYERFTNGNVKLLGKVEDLTPLYNQARLFVAPTRFSAGIPHKVHEAAAHGLPTVATSLTGAQLGWQHEEELLLADDPQAFADACIRLYQDSRLWNQIRQKALQRVAADCSPEAFADKLKAIIGKDTNINAEGYAKLK